MQTDIKGKNFDSNFWNIRPISVALLPLHYRETFQEIKQHRKFRSTLTFIIKKCNLHPSHVKIYCAQLCYG